MRGGLSHITRRYNKANKYYLKPHDSKQKSKHITYLDANNLIGDAVSRFCPTSGFKQRDPKEFDLNRCTNDSLKGCVLEFDLEYPR